MLLHLVPLLFLQLLPPLAASLTHLHWPRQAKMRDMIRDSDHRHANRSCWRCCVASTDPDEDESPHCICTWARRQDDAYPVLAYIQTYVHTYIHTCIHTYIHAYMYVRHTVYMCTCQYKRRICVHIKLYIYIERERERDRYMCIYIYYIHINK